MDVDTEVSCISTVAPEGVEQEEEEEEVEEEEEEEEKEDVKRTADFLRQQHKQLVELQEQVSRNSS